MNGASCRTAARMARAMCLLALVTGFLGAPLFAQPYRDPLTAIDTRVRDLLSRMTPREKFWQLFMLAELPPEGIVACRDGAFGFQFGMMDDSVDVVARINAVQRHFVENTRLGIPIIPFAEALHGLVQKGTTSFPQAIGLAATFDTTLMREVSAAIAGQCRRRGIRQILSPVINLASDVRWGRTEETYGEDPCLTSAMGVAFVSPFEEKGVITTPKHLIANAGDGGRDSYPIDLDERLLREIHLPPFEACLRHGGSRSVMTAYNSLDGTPCTAQNWLNNTYLKEELGFSGFVISDACAVGGALVLHFTADNYGDATKHALDGGLDVIFQTSYDHYTKFIGPFLDGTIDPAVIDRAVARVLRAKFQLGLFENPYVTSDPAAFAAELSTHRPLARRAAQESIVLLKNDHQTLPLDPDIETIAVLGPDADEVRLGGYSGPGNNPISILDGLTRRLGSEGKILHARGCDRVSVNYATVPSDVLFCTDGDTIRNGLRGQYYDNVRLEGEPVFTRIDPRIQFQWTLFSPDPQKLPYDFYSVRWTGTLKAPATGTYKIGIDGNDGYRLYIDDSLVIDNWIKQTRRTMVADFAFEKDKIYDLRLEYHEPTGNTWFKLIWNIGVPSDGQKEMDDAVRLAEKADVAVIAVGLEEGEFRDRAILRLPGRQEELINRVAATGRPTVVVLVGGSAVTMNNWLDNADAVLDVWYPGEEGGDAVGDVIFGDYNPAGRLPITFPVAEGQLPLVYNHKPTGRGDDYVDLTGQPLFPFGFGLSYTDFEYSGLSFDHQMIKRGDSTTVRFTVTNIGPREGEEVVQLYIHDELASVVRPVMELKAFDRIHLKPSETQEIHFTITPAMLSLLDADLKTVIEPGAFRVMIGSSSKDIRLRGILTVTD